MNKYTIRIGETVKPARGQPSVERRFVPGNPLAGTDFPDLAREYPTTLLLVHATFTIQHAINELRFHLEMDAMARNDRALLVELGKDAERSLEELEPTQTQETKDHNGHHDQNQHHVRARAQRRRSPRRAARSNGTARTTAARVERARGG